MIHVKRKMLVSSSLLISIALLTMNARAEQERSFIDENLLQCEKQEEHLRNCVFLAAALYPKFPVQMLFTVRYAYESSGTPLSIGVEQQDQANPTFHQFKAGSHALTFEGCGPLQLVDKKPRLTLIGQYAPDCTIRVNGIEQDLSPETHALVKDKLAHVETLLSLISETKRMSALAETIHTLINKIDIVTLSSLLKTLHGSTLTTLKSYKQKGALNAVQAVTRIFHNIEGAICDNPALREFSQEICGNGVKNENLCGDLEGNLQQFSNDSLNLVDVHVKAVVQAISDAFVMIGHGNAETKRRYHKAFCAFEEHLSESLLASCHEFEKNNA